MDSAPHCWGWIQKSGFPIWVWEKQVGHAGGDQSFEAYNQHQQIAIRRQAMEQYGEYCWTGRPKLVCLPAPSERAERFQRMRRGIQQRQNQKRRAARAAKGPLRNELLAAHAEQVRHVLAEVADMSEKTAAKELNRRNIRAPEGDHWHGRTVGRLRKRLGLHATTKPEALIRAERLRPVFAEMSHLSLRQAAAELNRRKIETKRGGRWEIQTVRSTRRRLGMRPAFESTHDKKLRRLAAEGTNTKGEDNARP